MAEIKSILESISILGLYGYLSSLSLMGLSQLGIGIFGVTAIALSQAQNKRTQRWACFFGLAGQPFWFYASYHGQQWGIFFLCFLYSLAWFKGFWNFWVVPYRNRNYI